MTAIGKALFILQVFENKPYQFSIAEIIEQTGLNRTTVYRIIAELEDSEFVIKHRLTDKYSIAAKFFHIAAGYLYKDRKFDNIKSIIDEVADQTKQNVGISVLEDNKIINLYDTELDAGMVIMYRQGSYFPYHCGAYGKSIMAYYQPRQQLIELLKQSQLTARTPNTITDLDRLLKEFEKIRAMGYAVSDEENLLGAYGIGVPIFDQKGDIYGSIALAAIKSTINQITIAEYIEVLKQAAQQISKYI